MTANYLQGLLSSEARISNLKAAGHTILQHRVVNAAAAKATSSYNSTTTPLEVTLDDGFYNIIQKGTSASKDHSATVTGVNVSEYPVVMKKPDALLPQYVSEKCVF